MSELEVPIGDADPEDAYDLEDPWDERASVLFLAALDIAARHDESRARYRAVLALALLARLAIERPERAAELGDLLVRLEALR